MTTDIQAAAPVEASKAHATTLAVRLAEPRPVLVPGCFDAFTALLVERAGFEAAFVSGAGIAYTRLGRPDVGLVTATEVVETVARIRDRVELPLVVDVDTGFGNALNVQRTVRTMERAGASAIQIEDQTFPKRCGPLKGKAVVPTAEMVGKVKAALDARERMVDVTALNAILGLAPLVDDAAHYDATATERGAAE